MQPFAGAVDRMGRYKIQARYLWDIHPDSNYTWILNRGFCISDLCWNLVRYNHEDYKHKTQDDQKE